VSDGLRVAAGEVQVGDGEFVEYRERALEALGGEVDRAGAGQWRGRGEEEGLRLDERTQSAVYMLVGLSRD
jgi:hypothetical protein